MAASPTTRRARDRFAELANRRAEHLAPDELELGATRIAAEEYPELDVAGVRDAFDALAARARERLADADGAARVEGLNRFLFGEEGFTGAREYYDPRNS